MTQLRITSDDCVFAGSLELEDAPETCAWFLDLLPFEAQVIHARWSGEAVWMPLGDMKSGLGAENHTIHPSKGEILFYPGGISEAEILLVYGASFFASRAGPLAGNHFITIVEGNDRLREFGNHVLWSGAQEIKFVLAD